MVEPKDRQEGDELSSPKIDLKDGTWAYDLLLSTRDHFGSQKPLSAEDTKKLLNSQLEQINQQGGKVVQIISQEVEGKPQAGVMGNPIETAHLVIVEK